MLTILQANPYEGMDSAAAAGMGMGMILFGIALYLFFAFCLYKIFQKAGVENPWAAFVPIYGNIVFAEVVKKPLWFGILMCVPYLNIIFIIWAFNRLSKCFGQGVGFTVGLVLLGFIFLPMLAFGNYQYNGNLVVDERN